MSVTNKGITSCLKLVVAVAVLAGNNFAYAGSASTPPAPTPAKAPTSGLPGGPGTTLEINPTVLQDLLLKRNLSVQLELQTLYTAKAQVGKAGANLLPSLNINLGAATNMLSFAVSTIAFLVPFLMPSNWLLLDEAKDQYKAEGVGYYLMKLNNAASIYGMYYSLVSDVDSYNVTIEQQAMTSDTYSLVQEKFNLGLATLADLKQAQEALAQANAHVSAAKNAIDQQNQAILNMVYYDVGTDIKADVLHETPSKLEGQSSDQIANSVVQASPEWLQMTYLIQAAVEGMKATEFSFFSGASFAGVGGQSGGSASFGNLSPSLGFNIGFGPVYNYRLSAIAVDMEKTQQQQVQATEDFAIGTTVANLNSAIEQLQYYQDAEDSSRTVYNLYLSKYKQGSTDLLHVFTAQTDLLTQEINRITSQSNVDAQRVGLKRIDREDQFDAIQPCDLADLGAHQNWFQRVGSIFSKPQLSVDKACANTNHEPDISSDNKKK